MWKGHWNDSLGCSYIPVSEIMDIMDLTSPASVLEVYRNLGDWFRSIDEQSVPLRLKKLLPSIAFSSPSALSQPAAPVSTTVQPAKTTSTSTTKPKPAPVQTPVKEFPPVRKEFITGELLSLFASYWLLY